MLCAGRHNVYSSGVYTAVTENIGKLGNILVNAVKNTREQMTEIVREYLCLTHPRLAAKSLHFAPDIASVKRLSAPRNEDRPRFYPPPLRIAQKPFSKLANDEYHSPLPLASNRDLAALDRLKCDEG